ncbi:double-strand-break repair protein rad21 homolog [Lytechinus variegatus]|uniref:double-strand-break repair protein rad21 homolog n=1 Tax=Lytechinus variegatus TaxID=7654 RepID=UPI001BB0ECCC|nr:double-strand-break repair protein rad21 homolog [Lytechinus variegatus]XP_041466106.1 double-strand-break repair protein rad21 homolog [Lytechinus variegatus]
MFYAHYVLSKKGPLAKIWLAAHWDKKLTKAHVFETNVSSCVDSIIHPKVKMALRTSGHLLLGVVRIHSRKAKYLLADCNEAFVKIKMAFRPGVVDLPEENREAAFTAITLPEVFHDFDTAVPDLNDAEVQKQFALNQSRVEEITMKEDLGNITLTQDDAFGDITFDDREMMRDAPNIDDSLYKRGSDESTMLSEMGNRKDNTIDTTLEKPMDLGLDEPIRDDGFGAEMGMGSGILGNEFMGPEEGLFDEQPEIHAGEVPMGGTASGESSPERPNEPEKQMPGQPMEQGEDVAEQPVADQTTLVPNDEDAFALEPIDISAGMKETRQRRKRKLIVDEMKELAGDVIKSQLKDTSDIVATLDLAPPTKKLMLWKETGGAEKLFCLPARQHTSIFILSIYRRNLTADIPKDLKIVRDEDFELEEPEVQRRVEHHDFTLEASRDQTSLSIDEPSRIEEQPSTSATPAPPAPADLPIPMSRRSSSSDGGDYGGDLFAGDYDDDYDIPSVAPQSVGPSDAEEPEEEEELQEGEDQEAHEERKLNKRAHNMLTAINTRLQTSSDVSFKHDLTMRLNRKQAAAKFYTLLVLKKQQAIDVFQNVTYGDITIQSGPMLEGVA